MTRSELLQSVFRHFRSKRMRLFEQAFPITPQTRVLDVGGSPDIWEFARVRPQLTLLNLEHALPERQDRAELVAGDGRLLPFADGAFDIVFSNSVIEHLGSHEGQQRFASEIARVGRSYWVQTPNRQFPFELHLMLPLVHLLPKPVQRAIVSRFTVWQMLLSPPEPERRAFLDHYLTEVILLDRRGLSGLFPQARILAERSLGLSKSLIALKA
jgi:hypothetical protein